MLHFQDWAAVCYRKAWWEILQISLHLVKTVRSSMEPHISSWSWFKEQREAPPDTVTTPSKLHSNVLLKQSISVSVPVINQHESEHTELFATPGFWQYDLQPLLSAGKHNAVISHGPSPNVITTSLKINTENMFSEGNVQPPGKQLSFYDLRVPLTESNRGKHALQLPYFLTCADKIVSCWEEDNFNFSSRLSGSKCDRFSRTDV